MRSFRSTKSSSPGRSLWVPDVRKAGPFAAGGPSADNQLDVLGLSAAPTPSHRNATATRTAGKRPRSAPRSTPKRRQQTAKQHAARFGVDCLHPGDDGVELRAIHKRYKAWCAEKGIEPLSAIQISDALAEVFEEVGIAVTEERGRLIAAGLPVAATLWLSLE